MWILGGVNGSMMMHLWSVFEGRESEERRGNVSQGRSPWPGTFPESTRQRRRYQGADQDGVKEALFMEDAETSGARNGSTSHK